MTTLLIIFGRKFLCFAVMPTYPVEFGAVQPLVIFFKWCWQKAFS